MIKINLIPRDIIAKAQQKQSVTQAIVIGVGILAVVVVASAAHQFKVMRLESTLQENKHKLNALQAVVEKVKALEEQVNAVRTRLNVITDLLKGRPLYPYFMMDIAKTLPTGVWLTQLGTRSGQAANQLSINASASASSQEAIATWLRNLVNSGQFSEPTLSAISISGTEAAKTNMFSITTDYHSPKI